MELRKKRVEIVTVMIISLICIGFGNLLIHESGSRFTVGGTVGGTEVDENYATTLVDVDGNGKVDLRDISLVARSFPDSESSPRYDVTGDGKLDFRDIAVTAQSFGKGVFSIDVRGDASGLYMMCEMARQFTASKLEWSTSLPSYPSGYVEFNLAAKTLGLEKLNDWSYHMSLRGLEEGSMISAGYVNYVLMVQSTSGDLDFIFYDRDSNYPYYYHTADIVGALKGNVYFHIDLPDIAEFHYEGRELTIYVHIAH